MMMNDERFMQRLIERNSIMSINNKYCCVVRDLTEAGFEVVNVSESFETVEEAFKHYMRMNFKYRRKCAMFRRNIRLLNEIATYPMFQQTKRGYRYRVYKKGCGIRQVCLVFGGFKSKIEAELHYLNNRIYILKKILGDDNE